MCLFNAKPGTTRFPTPPLILTLYLTPSTVTNTIPVASLGKFTRIIASSPMKISAAATFKE